MHERNRFSMLLCSALPGCLAVALLCGCASPVQLVQPPWFAQEISSQPISVRIEPIAYLMSTKGQGMIVRVFNLTDRPMTIRPDASYVIDPWNQSASIREEIIPAHGSTTLKLPPKINYTVWEPLESPAEMNYRRPLPVYYPEMHSSEWPPYTGDTRQTSVHSAYMWKWPEGRIRLHLEFESAGKRFHHDFVFERGAKQHS